MVLDPRKVKTGQDLRQWRDGRSQSAIAALLKTSQRKISECESAPAKELPAWMAARIRGEDEGVESASHSWPQTLFKALRAKSNKQADEVVVQAVISRAKDNPGYADYAARITFHHLVIPDGQALHLDHVRDPGDDRSLIQTPGVRRPRDAQFNLVLGGSELLPDSMQVRDGRKHEVLVRQGGGALLLDHDGRSNDISMHVVRTLDHGSVRARVKEDDRLHLPAFLAYELACDARDPVTVYVRSDEGFNLTTSDAVNFTYYTEADFIVERIRLEIEFRDGLVPSPDPPSARAQLIRRTTLRPSSLQATFPNPTKTTGSTPNSVRYTFGPLLRPKGGGISTVWSGRASRVGIVGESRCQVVVAGWPAKWSHAYGGRSGGD